MSTSRSFQAALGRGVLVFDGAMGTEIYRHHVFTNRSFDELCLSDPKLIRHIHTDYSRRRGRRAHDQHVRRQPRGAGASSAWPRSVREINRAGGRLAREVADAADRPVFVAGSHRPVAARSRNTKPLVEEMIVEQAASLMEGGADFILFETQPSRAALEQCAAAMRRLPDVPFVLSFALVDEPVRVGLGRAGRADDGPAARRLRRSRSPGA